MDLYILRHGIAEDLAEAPGKADAFRRLTREGARKVRRAAAGMRRLGIRPDLILSSPYDRAWQTAKIVAKAFKVPKALKQSEQLRPDGDPARLIAELRAHARLGRVMLVGHEPYLSGLVSTLISGETLTGIELKKGGLCKLAAQKLLHGRCATLEWLMTPGQLRKL